VDADAGVRAATTTSATAAEMGDWPLIRPAATGQKD
jgi:hypothetical protein